MYPYRGSSRIITLFAVPSKPISFPCGPRVHHRGTSPVHALPSIIVPLRLDHGNHLAIPLDPLRDQLQLCSNMAGILESPSSSGQVYYLPWIDPPVPAAGYFRPRRSRPASLRITRVTEGPNPKDRAKHTPRRYIPGAKLANSRDNAKRFLRFVSSSHSTSNTVPPGTPTSRDSIPPRHIDIPDPPLAEEMVFADGERSRSQTVVGGPVSGMVHRPSLVENVRTASVTSTASSRSTPNVTGAIGDEKPIASGNGVSISIALAEPVLFLQGFDQADAGARTTSMLRGSLHLHVSKNAKIKAVTLTFRGRSETEWPEGESLASIYSPISCKILIGYILRRHPAQKGGFQRYRKYYEPYVDIFQRTIPYGRGRSWRGPCTTQGSSDFDERPRRYLLCL